MKYNVPLKHYDCVENHKYVPLHIPSIQLDAELNLTKVVNSSCLTFSKICNPTVSLNNYKCTGLTLSWNIDKKWFSCRFECHFVYLWFDFNGVHIAINLSWNHATFQFPFSALIHKKLKNLHMFQKLTMYKQLYILIPVLIPQGRSGRNIEKHWSIILRFTRC